MADWRDASLLAWNNALLEHLFRRRSDDDGPVVAIVATPDVLASAIGAPEAIDSAVVHEHFVNLVVQAIGGKKSLLEHAADYEGSPGPPSADQTPTFVAHLFFTCLAASVSTIDLAEEGSFVDRLRTFSNQQLPAHSMDWLPRLWEYLSGWLDANSVLYRELRLPARGRLRRIGYTVGLTFPDRRDQKKLAQLLSEAGLMGKEPPVDEVLAMIAADRVKSFTSSFTEALEEFSTNYSLAVRDDGTAATVFQHRFWVAVREAALRGRFQRPGNDAPVVSVRGTKARVDALDLVATVEYGQLRLLLASSSPRPHVGAFEGVWDAAAFDLPGEGTKYAIFQPLETGRDFDHPVRAVLEGRLQVPGLSASLQRGLLFFASLGLEYFEMCNDSRPSDAAIILAKEDIEKVLLPFVRPRRGRLLDRDSSRYAGWVQFVDCEMAVPPASETPPSLADALGALRPRFRQEHIGFSGGVRVADGFVGFGPVLPRVVVSAARTVALRQIPAASRAPSTLRSLSETEWLLPCEDLAGEFVVDAELQPRSPPNAARLATRVRFYRRAEGRPFKGLSPERTDGYFAEGTLSDCERPRAATQSTRITHVGESIDHADSIWDTYFLGGAVGDIRPHSEENCAWRLRGRYGRWVLEYFGSSGGEVPVRGEVSEDGGSVRFWRRLFSGHLPVELAPAGPEAVEARRRWRGHALKRELVEVECKDQARPAISRARARIAQGRTRDKRQALSALPEQPLKQSDSSVLSRVDCFAELLAARAERVQLLSPRELQELVIGLLDPDMDYGMCRLVIRAWVEAGALTPLYSRTWCAMSYLPQAPSVVAYRMGHLVHGTIMGVVTESLRERVRAAAQHFAADGLRLEASTRPRWVAPPPRLVAPSHHVLARMSGYLGLGSPEWLAPLQSLPRLDEVISPNGDAPGGFAELAVFDWQQHGFWDVSAQTGATAEGVHLQRRRWRNGPDHYVVMWNGREAWWTRSKVWALLVALALRGSAAVSYDGGGLVPSFEGVHLPVGVGRLLAAYGPAVPEPLGIGSENRYVYPCPTPRFGREVVERYASPDVRELVRNRLGGSGAKSPKVEGG